MAFYLKSNFTMNKGVYGELFWCGYQDDDTIYIAKKLKDVDFSLYIEKEAAIRLSSLPTVYNVKSLELHEGKKYLVSKYVSGPLLKDYYSQNMENIFLHILCTLEVMGRCGVCHNDLHTGNIIITKSDLTHVKYCFGSEYLTVNVNGELPVLIDYGQANIENYRYRPVITGLDLGNFASLIHDNRFDKLKIYYSFKELLEPGKLRTLISHLGKPTLKNLSVWVKKNVGLLWNPINLNLEYKFIKVFDLVDYHTSGMFLSFPPITMPDYDTVYDKLDNLWSINFTMNYH
uniref:Putative phosphotransferase n=1 Tax=Erythrocytic necrosis virus TaxID=1543320 RepID=A0A4D6QIH0_9VIRU|nr:putative phosphotransferase [Erythrocytic necrosis virus]